jgi:hypothetical protein
MPPLFSPHQDSEASALKASGKRCICRPVPSALLGDTWSELGEGRFARHPEKLHRLDSELPTDIDNEPPTRVMSAAEIAEALSC